jgi:putative inorganic carbon (hco3(-)) transporter
VSATAPPSPEMTPARAVTAPRSSGVAKVVTFLLVFLAVAVSAFSGLSAGTGSRLTAVLPVVGFLGLVLSALALTRFSVYVMLMLVIRASLDLVKLSGAGDGSTTTATSATPRALDPSSLLAVLFLLFAVLWLAAQLHQQGRLPGAPLRRALLWFAAAGAISVLGAVDPRASALEWLRIVAVVVMFIVLEQMMVDTATMRQILLACFLSTIFPLAFTTFGFLVGHPRTETKGSFVRIMGTFTQSNGFGRYLMYMIIFGAALYPYVSKKVRIPLGLMLAMSSVFLLLTYTRTALLGTVLGLAIVGLIQSKRLVLILMLAGALALVAVPQMSARFTDLANTSTPGSGSSGNSLAWRLNWWGQVLPLANSNPVTGIGLGMTSDLTDAAQPHNDYVRAYVETGLLGFGAYLAMLIALVGLGRRAVQASQRGTFDRGVAAGFLGCAVAYVAASLAANVMSNVVSLWYLFAFAAAASAVVRRRDLALRSSNGAGVMAPDSDGGHYLKGPAR